MVKGQGLKVTGHKM